MSYELMSARVLANIDPDRYPTYEKISCMECGGRDGHTEEVWTGKTDDDGSGWEVWFCCHACRDRGEPCETFFPIRLRPDAVV